MNYWTVTPKKINVQTTSTSTSNLPGAPSSYAVSNGTYDQNGNLLFYIVDGTIFSAAGTIVGNLFMTATMGNEIVIVPKPNSCRNFYAIYLNSHVFVGQDLLFTEIDCSGTNPVVVANGILDSFSGNIGGLAASKPLANGSRWLFVVAYPGVKKYKIASSGITIPIDAVILDFAFSAANNVKTEAPELELLEGQTWKLAWGDVFSNPPQIFKIDLTANTATYIANSFLAKTVTGATGMAGLEFKTPSTALYVSGGNGVYDVPLNTTNAVTLLNSSSDYGNSQIERAKNSKFYLVSNSGKFGQVDGNQIIASPAPLSAFTVQSQGFFVGATLNDQVDADNYNYFFGIPQVGISNYKVNSVSVSASIPPAALEVYNCNPITLTSTYSGAPTQYKIDLYKTDPTNGQQLICGTCLNYSSGWITATPPTSFDLKNLPGTNGTWLQSNTGNYAVKLSIRTACANSEVSKIGQIKVNAAPPTAQINLQINNGLTGTPCNASHNIATPCLTGIYSASFNLSNSNGTITYYQINSIQEVNCASGAIIQTLYTGSQVAVSGVSGLTALSFNGLTINSSTGYFAANGLNKCYKVTVTVGNVCGSSSDWAYFRCDGSYKTEPTISYTTDIADFGIYPNPFDSWMSVGYTLKGESTITLSLSDMSGKIMATPIETTKQVAGTYSVELPLADLPQGIYIYRFVSGNTVKTGKIAKISD